MAQKISRRPRELKICLVGDIAVGKSSLIRRYVYGDFDVHHDSTLGNWYHSKPLKLDDTSYILQIWDTAGQEKYRSISSLVFRQSHVILLIFDITRKTSLDSLHFWREAVSRHAPEDAAIIVVGNKSDLAVNREVSMADIEEHCQKDSSQYIECSAFTGTHVSNLFETAVRCAPKSRPANRDSIVIKQDPTIPTKENQARQKCCSSS